MYDLSDDEFANARVTLSVGWQLSDALSLRVATTPFAWSMIADSNTIFHPGTEISVTGGLLWAISQHFDFSVSAMAAPRSDVVTGYGTSFGVVARL